MRVRFIVTIVMLWASVASGSHQAVLSVPKQTGLSAPWQQRLKAIAQTFDAPGASLTIYDVAHQTISHGQVGVIRQNKCSAGHGQRLFNFGSIAKQFVAVTLLQMQANGKLSLDQSVTDLEKQYGPWLTKQQSAQWSSICLRSLLHMTSGIPDYWSSDSIQGYLRHASKDDTVHGTDKLLDWAQQHGSMYASGSQWSYSDTNYLILVKLIEHINHQSFSDVVGKRVLGQGGSALSHTYVDVSPHMTHVSSPNDIVSCDVISADIMPDKLAQQRRAGVGARFLLSTTDDMARWFAMLFDVRHGRLGDVSAMKTLVSKQSGKPIHDGLSSGYGMALDRVYVPGYGNIWYYPGNSQFGSAYLIWSPKANQVLSIAINRPIDTGLLHGLLIKYMIEDDVSVNGSV
jgi:D-alanyl-D-alanine carboxypeptidase